MIAIEEFISRVEGEFEDMEPGNLSSESVLKDYFWSKRGYIKENHYRFEEFKSVWKIMPKKPE